MVTPPVILAMIALLFFAVRVWDAKGRDIGWWGAVLLAVAFLWSRLT